MTKTAALDDDTTAPREADGPATLVAPHRIPATVPTTTNRGRWFLAAPYPSRLRDDIFVLLDGRVLDVDEIAEGVARRYARVPLFDTEAQAARALARARPMVTRG